MQVALEAKTLVLPAVVCGNGICEDEEICSTCPADCGECTLQSDTQMAIAIPVALIIASFILAAVVFQYQKQKMFWDESWIIDFNKIKQDHSMVQNTTGSTLSAAQAASDSNASCTTALSSCTAAVSTSRKPFFTQTGRYDGRIVAIKKIQKKTFTLSKTIRKEVKQIRDLDHPNLCKFIGGCTEVPNVAIITEYCPKGSLSDVLLSDDIPLNWGFRFSFANDIAHGMAYLHQHRMYHSRLKSTNCVIDDRWVCKITDYGLDTYRKEDSCDDSNIYQERIVQVYMPPEGDTVSSPEKSAAADMYSYAIILLEIATRNDPVPKDETSSAEYCCLPLPELIKGKSENACPCPAEYVELIRRCRSQNPAYRPTFEQVKKQLYKMNPNKVSPVDMMMTLMEKYSKHLELLVAERTQDLMHEKQKTDRLLYSMLPKQVADDLRQGKPSQAQSYTSATIFFSDIVGFTQLSSSSTPYQVVDFLNKLYTTFDEIIDNYDVYKVETIGDAYMVVSGVPKENGILHGSEIASMALDLVSVCKTFRIPHKPNTQLRIRAGIHSGPVVAGVVGTKMPRYCLFGDTVNTASRMESTSEALKIQCSSSTHDLLKQIGGYLLVCRGTLQVKGKGDMITYWLEGKMAISTKKVNPHTAAIQEKERDSFNLIPGVLCSEALSTSF
ncbi:atrial natriuretic peptide receptor 1-like [Rhinophrynus dorsalis]